MPERRTAEALKAGRAGFKEVERESVMMKSMFTVSVLMAAVAPAVASEAAMDPSRLAGDVGAALWTLIIFALVVFILGKFAWGPILGVFQKREEFIRDSLEQARKDREAAEATLKEYSDKLHAAKLEATAIVDEGRRDAEAVKRKVEEEAKGEADAIIARAKREIGIATDTAVKELYDLTGRLATDVAARIIRKELDPREHERLIAESVEELGRISRN